MTKGIILLLLVLLVLSFTYCDAIDQIKQVIANLEAQKITLTKNFNESSIHSDLKSCDTTLPYLESKLKKISADKAALEVLMQQLVAEYIKLKDKKPEYEKELICALEEWEKQKAEIEQQVKIALQFIKYLKQAVGGIDHPGTEQPKAKIISLLEEIEKYYEDQLKNMTPPANIEKLKLKIQQQEILIVEQDKKIEQTKVEYNTVVELEKSTAELLTNQTQICKDKATELENMKKKLAEDLKSIDFEIARLYEEIKRLEDEARKQKERERILAEIAAQYGLLNGTESRLNTSMYEQARILASDPKPECDATLAQKTDEIAALEVQEKNITATLRVSQDKVIELTPIVDGLSTNSTNLFAAYSAQQKLCNDLAAQAVQDPSLLRQIDAIQKLLDLVSELAKQQKLSNNTATSIIDLLHNMQNDLRNTIAQKLAEAIKRAQECRVVESDLKTQYEQVYVEYKNKKSELASEQAKVDSLSSTLTSLQNAKKVAVALYQDKLTSCNAAYTSWTASKDSIAATIAQLTATIQIINKEIEALKKQLAVIV